MAATCNNAATIGISFSNGGGDYFEAVFDKFTQPPRTYLQNSDLSFSVAGAAVVTGNSRANRRTWAIASYGTREDAFTIDEMYRAWDLDRSTGRAAVLGVTDSTFVRDPSTPISAIAVFTAIPEFEQRSGNLWLISFGMTEI